MRQLVSIILLVQFVNICSGQPPQADYSEYYKTLKEQAEIMSNSLLKKDYKAFAKFTHPTIIKYIGGEQKMIETMEKGTKEWESNGISMEKVSFGEASIIHIKNNELQCTLRETLEMKVPKGKLIINSTLIAVSKDNGKNWYFIDVSNQDSETIKKLFPELSESLVIPPKEQSVFIEEN